MMPDSIVESLVSEPWIVGLGASAGGLEALDAFFDALPTATGAAFVVITHQHPTTPSLLPELLARHTAMPVRVVSERVPLVADTIFVAPSGVDLDVVEGTLQPRERDASKTIPLPIDHFFRSLAAAQGERAVGIVLSGTGSDGTAGIRAIKGAGGLVMAQSPSSTSFTNMPNSAIQTGLVDHVLAPHQLPAQLLAHFAGEGQPVSREPATSAPTSSVLDEIFGLMLAGVGHDFSGYKRTTIQRRIERRMSVQQVASLADYVALVRDQPAELHALFNEMLIGVTGFFRDPEAFASLERLLHESAARSSVEPLRVWVPGCSTGEEAYSVAMLLRECLDSVAQHPGFQVFATDLDASAIAIARNGSYPESIAAEVSPERLERFFVAVDGRYQIKKELRERLIFAQQNLIADPPFTRLDLLCCRNLLIYLDADLQRRLVPIFHYSLRRGGLLFLGSSESIGPYGDLFEMLDKKWKICRRREIGSTGHLTPLAAARAERAERGLTPADKSTHGLEDATARVLLDKLVPPSVLVHPNGAVVHIHGRTGAFLEPAPGPQPSATIFEMAREGLRLNLGAALRQACRQVGPVVHQGVRIKSGSEHVLVDLRVEQLSRPEQVRGLLLISFLDHHPSPRAPEAGAEGLERVDELERELSYAKETNQGTIEELETANEELKSINEELQSTNEELQSTNEELETSKEEMQSLNEELQTVNAELHAKVEELSRTTDDMKNLLNGTSIATIFLDDRLRIQRFTEQAKDVIRLIPSDIGRPIGDLVSRLHYDRLAEDATEVLRTLTVKQAEIRGEGDTWYLMRILPYRTTDEVIDGLVVTFVDVTEVKKLQFEQRMLRALAGVGTTIFGVDTQLRVTWSSGPVFGQGESLRGVALASTLPSEQAERLLVLMQTVCEHRAPVHAQLELEIEGVTRSLSIYVEPVLDDAEHLIGLTCVCVDRRVESVP